MKVRFNENLKIILKVVKKPGGKFLRAWAKNQWRLNVENILKFTYKHLNGKLTFYPFLSHLPGPLLFYTAWKITPFFYNFFGFGGGGSFPLPLCVCPWKYYTSEKVL